MRHLIQIVDEFEARGAGLHIIETNFDTTSATADDDAGKAARRDPQGEGGREMQGTCEDGHGEVVEVEAMLSAGTSPSEVARRLKIGRSSVYRAMRLRNIKREPTTYRPA